MGHSLVRSLVCFCCSFICSLCPACVLCLRDSEWLEDYFFCVFFSVLDHSAWSDRHGYPVGYQWQHGWISIVTRWELHGITIGFSWQFVRIFLATLHWQGFTKVWHSLSKLRFLLALHILGASCYELHISSWLGSSFLITFRSSSSAFSSASMNIKARGISLRKKITRVSFLKRGWTFSFPVTG